MTEAIKNYRPRCLILTPFKEDFFSIREHIAKALEEIGIEPILVEEQMKIGDEIRVNIHQAIESAALIILDLTGFSPNVMYELGLAHAKRKPVMLMVQREFDRIPADLEGYHMIVYNPEEPIKLKRLIMIWAQRYIVEREQAEPIQ